MKSCSSAEAAAAGRRLRHGAQVGIPHDAQRYADVASTSTWTTARLGVGRELGPGAGICSRSAAAARQSIVLVAAGDDLQPDRHAVDEPGGMLTPGWPVMLNGAVNAADRIIRSTSCR